LLEVERVAARLLVDLVRPRAPDAVAEQVARVLAGEAAELDPSEAVVAVGPRERGREAIGCLTRACGHHNEHGGVGRAAQQRGEQLHRRGVRPVDVVEHEHDRAAHRQPLEQLPHRAMGPVALVLYDGGAVGGQVRERRHHVRQLAAHLHGQRRHELRVDAGEVLVERVDEHPEREVLLELGRAAAEDGAAAVVRPRGQLRQQPGLADPGLALDHQRRSPAVTQLLERAIDRPQLGGAPDEMVGDSGHGTGTARRA
jgi:hypothetical protein